MGIIFSQCIQRMHVVQLVALISPRAPRTTSKMNLSEDVCLHLLRPKAVGLVCTTCDALSPQGLGLVA